jgi:hypothetical protein
MEHSPVTLETLRNVGLAVRECPAARHARVPVNELWTAEIWVVRRRLGQYGIQHCFVPDQTRHRHANTSNTQIRRPLPMYHDNVNHLIRGESRIGRC